MKKSFKAIAIACAALLSLGVAGCSKSTDYPDYYNPEGVQPAVDGYKVYVQSKGGMRLNGVTVAVKNSEGVTVKRGITDATGEVDFGIALGEYTLEVDANTLPAGYSVDGTVYKTNPEARDPVTISLPSKVIENGSASSYSIGQIMDDFKFTDCNNVTHRLSESLTTKKAVILNFWYTGCNPCKAEFPAVQEAYNKYSASVDIYAICDPNPYNDTNFSVSKFKNDYKLSFPMGIDTLGMTSAFNVTGYPTTVVVDRYGLIAFRSKGTEVTVQFWEDLFKTFTADDYVQKVSGATTGEVPAGGDEQKEPERVKPNVSMPSSDVLKAAGTDGKVEAVFTPETSSTDKDYSWPWLAHSDGADSYIYTSNKGVNSSFATVHCAVSMKAGDALSFDYYTSCEKDCDFLYALIDGQVMNPEGWTGTELGGPAADGWHTATLYVSDREKTVDLAFLYQKDEGDKSQAAAGNDVARIRNIRLVNTDEIAEPLDVLRSAVYGKQADSTSYDEYVEVVHDEANGLYKRRAPDGTESLLYVSLIQPTAWTDAHMKSKLEVDELTKETYYNSLYHMSYHLYGREGGKYFVFNGKSDLSGYIQSTYIIQGFMEYPYNLLPVTDKMHEWITAFIRQKARDDGRTLTPQEEEREWLEFCFYYDHYGPDHDDGSCYMTKDRTRGLFKENCYEAYLNDDPALNSSETKGSRPGTNRAIIEYPLDVDKGTYYKFTAKDKGVYQIRAYDDRSLETGTDDTSLFVKDAQDNYMYNGKEIMGVLDYDQFTVPTADIYTGFNTYLELEAGQTVYLKLCVSNGDVGEYDFEISYKGLSHDVLIMTSIDFGAWLSDGKFNAIPVGMIGDKYYALDANGDADPTKPIYIDFIYGSCFSHYAYHSLEYIMDRTHYDDVFNFIIPNEDPTVIQYARPIMETYLAQAKAGNGMVEADKTLVQILQLLVENIGNGKNTNAWLAFGYYTHTYGFAA